MVCFSIFFLCFTFSFLFPFAFVEFLNRSHPIKNPLIFTEGEPIWSNRNTTRRLVGKEDRIWKSASRDWRPGGTLTSDLPLVSKVDMSLSFAKLSRECRIVFRRVRSSR